MCSKYENHLRVNSQHDQGDIYDRLMIKPIFTLILNKMFICAPKFMRNVGHNLNFGCAKPSSRVSYPRRSSLVKKTNNSRPIYLKILTNYEYRNTIADSFFGERIIIFFEKIRFASQKTEFLNFCFLAKNQ